MQAPAIYRLHAQNTIGPFTASVLCVKHRDVSGCPVQTHLNVVLYYHFQVQRGASDPHFARGGSLKRNRSELIREEGTGMGKGQNMTGLHGNKTEVRAEVGGGGGSDQ